ncbi:hypothetical protein CsSME_00022930 [Camellia sinensis var. sinensis]
MARDNLTQMARKRNAERMATRQKAVAIRSGLVPTESVALVVVQETAHVVVAETENEVKHPITEARPILEDRGEKQGVEVEGQRSRAEFEAMRAAMESARAEVEKERAKIADQLKSDAEERANASEESLKLAKEVLAKLEAEFGELKQAKEKADSESSATFEAGKSSAFKDYVEEVPKFENRGFKHGWLTALAAAGVTLATQIPYEQVDVEPLESDPET